MSIDARQFAKFLRVLPDAIDADPFVDESEEVAEAFRKGVTDNFIRQADSRNITWPPRRILVSHPPLRRTLKMFRAATSRGAPGAIQEIRHRRVRLAIDRQVVPYASDHQFGTKRLPRRQFFYLNTAQRAKMRSVSLHGMKRVLRFHQRRYQQNAQRGV